KNFNSLRWFISGQDWLCKIMRDDETINVIRYDEKFEEIIDKDLDINLTGNKNFIDKFFAAIDNGPELRNKYLEVHKNKKQSKSDKFAIYENIIHRINKSLINVSNKFNELYSLTEEKYFFELRRKETNNIYRLSLFVQNKNNENVPINLDEQSWGFKWFFNFFFNVFSNKMPYPGDIVLLEEPAVNLHVEGQIKWMKFVREFAENNKLTFVITTHSPFLIDPDRLDEIRIIYKEGKYCKINNYFSINSDEDVDSHDSLLSIKKSMTFPNMASILYGSKNNQFYLVDGIKEYAIFTYFKRIDPKYKDLHFIPINGVGAPKDNDESIKLIIENIIDVYGQNVKILVDNDEAGIRFQTLSNNHNTGLRIINLSEVDKTDIESLFNKDDLTIIQNSKNSDKAKSASKSLGLLSLSGKPEEYFTGEIINNFKNLFEILLKP
ncbi:MAG: AAA family ATPase, partial [Metamycoplasmataceae bacterium]